MRQLGEKFLIVELPCEICDMLSGELHDISLSLFLFKLWTCLTQNKAIRDTSIDNSTHSDRPI